MDLGTIPEWFTAVSAIAVAVAAWKGLNAWEREAIGRRSLELAEQSLGDFYRARDAMKWVRSPLVRAGEGTSRPRADDEDESLAQLRDARYAPIERLKEQGELFSELHARRYRVIALFGPEAAAPHGLVSEVRNRVIIAAEMLIEEVGQGPLPQDQRKQLRRDLIARSKDDELGDLMEKAVEKAEELFRPHIQALAPTRRWWPWL